MPNEEYQALFGASRGGRARDRRSTALDGDERAAARAAARRATRARSAPLVRDLGGHDLADVLDALRRARETTDRPTVIFAYTIKGYGLAIAGRPQNHSALLDGEQIDRLRAASGPDSGDRVGRLRAGDARRAAARSSARQRLDRGDRAVRPPRSRFPRRSRTRDPAATSTQAAFGRILLDLSRVEGVGERLVTVSPDVSVSTNLGGFINKTGVWGPDEEPVYDAMEDSPLKWRVGPTGQHIEMGIAEMNLVLLLGQLGLTLGLPARAAVPDRDALRPVRDARARGHRLLAPTRASRFVLAGTPSGISLSREGGAHQSLITPGIGIETPGLDLRRAVLRARARVAAPRRARAACRSPTARRSTSASRRSRSTRRRSPSGVRAIGEEQLRADVVAGGFRLREPGAGDDRVILATCGAIVPEALAAADAARRRRRASRRPCSASRRPIVSTATGRRRRTAPLRGRAGARRRTSSGSSRPTSAACPS